MKKILLILFVTMLLPLPAEAASAYIIAPASVNVDGSFTAEVFLDTEGENINAVEGSITVPDVLSVEDIRYGGSVVSLWLEEPKVSGAGVIRFAGVLPGGYQASPERKGKGNLFSITFLAKQIGTGRIALGEGSRAYRNDGEGSALPLSQSSASVAVVASGAPEAVSQTRDQYPPEPFTPIAVPGEPYGIQGTVLVFAAQDKDSGIDRYEFSSSYARFMPEFLLSWKTAESPLQLSREEMVQYLFVRAHDRAGNSRVGVAKPSEFGIVAALVTWGVPLLILIAVILAFLRLPQRRKVSLK